MNEFLKYCGIQPNPPNPYDPSQVANIMAISQVGAVRIKVSLPTNNPSNVAYFNLYKSHSNVFNKANLLTSFSGFDYLDTFNDPLHDLNYYWVELVSVNGTIHKPVGPATGRSLSPLNDLLDILEGNLSDKHLSIPLIEKIGKIDFLEEGIHQESEYRKGDYQTLARAFNSLQATFGESQTAFFEEVLLRSSADSSLGSAITMLQASVGEDLATYRQEVTVMVNRVDNDLQALSRTVTTNQVSTNNAIASVRTDMSSEIQRLGNEISVVSSKTDTVQSNLNGQISSVRTDMQTQINTTNGKVNSIGARWTLLLDVNGYVTDFGVYNTGQTSTAAFRVDRFYIGNSASGNEKPFEVVDKKVYIRSAVIRDATITNAKIANLAVDNLKIKNSAVSTGKIEANAVTIQGNVGDTETAVSLATGRTMDVNLPVAGNVTFIVIRGAYKTGAGYGTAGRPGFLLNGIRHNFFAAEEPISPNSDTHIWPSTSYATTLSLPAGNSSVNFRVLSATGQNAPIFVLILVNLR